MLATQSIVNVTAPIVVHFFPLRPFANSYTEIAERYRKRVPLSFSLDSYANEQTARAAIRPTLETHLRGERVRKMADFF